MTKTIYYAGEPGDGYGWGVCNKYLIRELGKLCDLKHWPMSARDSENVFVPIANHALEPSCSVRGTKKTFGYCFFEFPLGPEAAENAKQYDLIFCGSTWCKERLAEIGVQHTEVLIQGVDYEIFKPGPPPKDNEFRIFSGGKFEYRKGQDIVLAAFKLLQDKYPDIRLVHVWQNPWPELIQGMRASPNIKMPNGTFQSFGDFCQALYEANGIDTNRMYGYDLLPQTALATLMNDTQLGVFPNRCEGGTNLVLMEYLACGRPAIASDGTGHRDIRYKGTDIECYIPMPGYENEMHWCDVSPITVAGLIQRIYKNTRRPNPILDTSFTWERAARQILEHC